MQTQCGAGNSFPRGSCAFLALKTCTYSCLCIILHQFNHLVNHYMYNRVHLLHMHMYVHVCTYIVLLFITLTWWRSFFSIAPLVSLSCSQLSNFCCSSLTFFKSGTESDTCSNCGRMKTSGRNHKGWDNKKITIYVCTCTCTVYVYMISAKCPYSPWKGYLEQWKVHLVTCLS